MAAAPLPRSFRISDCLYGSQIGVEAREDGISNRMTNNISALIARTQFGQIMNRAVEHNERFLVERNGEPAVLILSVADFVKTLAPPPDWLEKVLGYGQAQQT
jgi:hypothetical protein